MRPRRPAYVMSQMGHTSLALVLEVYAKVMEPTGLSSWLLWRQKKRRWKAPWQWKKRRRKSPASPLQWKRRLTAK